MAAQGRKPKRTVEYFPHFIGDGKKMFYIEHKYGNDGYATWFKILETLATSDDHFICLQDDMDIMFLSAKCRIEKDTLLNIINDLCTLGQIDQYLWSNKIIYSHKFIESIQVVYERRNNKCMQYADFCIHYRHLCTTEIQQNGKIVDGNTQTKLNYTKLNKSRGNEPVFLDDFEAEIPMQNTGMAAAENELSFMPFTRHKYQSEVSRAYRQIYTQAFNVEPTFGQYDPANLNSICKRIISYLEKTGIAPVEEDVYQCALMLFAQASETKWLKDNFTTGNIEKKFDVLVKNLKVKAETNNGLTPWD